MNSTQHDELAQLFAQNMQLDYQAVQQTPPPPPPPPPAEPMVAAPSEKEQLANHSSVHYIASPIHYISAHYTGTAHLTTPAPVSTTATTSPSSSPPPPYVENYLPSDHADLLRQSGIDPSALLPAQAQLFTSADWDQKSRLVELWRISPPSYPLEQHLQTEWVARSIESEEREARERYEAAVLAQRQRQYEEHMLDTHEPPPISPIREVGETPWPPAARIRAASIAASKRTSTVVEAEPYMSSGYRQASDPVYGAGSGLWQPHQTPTYQQAVEQQPAMEMQYGMFEQIRNHADWEAMNERIAKERLGGMQRQQDEDMEL